MTSHAAQMGVFAAPIRAEAAPIRAKADGFRAFAGHELAIGHDLSSPKGARAYAEHLARETVMAAQADAGTKDAAIHGTARRYKLGSFLRKLWKGEPCALHLDKIIRLERAHADAVRSIRERFGGA
jgi:hypothetical protein